jgi:hypothetical protein
MKVSEHEGGALRRGEKLVRPVDRGVPRIGLGVDGELALGQFGGVAGGVAKVGWRSSCARGYAGVTAGEVRGLACAAARRQSWGVPGIAASSDRRCHQPAH